MNTAILLLIDRASPWSWVTKTKVMPDGALDGLQLDLHLLAQLEIQRPERLVEQQHLGVVHQRPGQGDTLALPAAQLRGLAVAEPAEAHDVEHLGGAPAALGPGHSLDPQPVLHVALHRHVREQGVVLEHRVHVAVVGRHTGHVLSLQQHGAGGGQFEAGDHPQHRGLAASGWAEQREELALTDGDIHVVDRDHVAERLAQPDQLDRRPALGLGGRRCECHGDEVTHQISTLPQVRIVPGTLLASAADAGKLERCPAPSN
ncbi:MAG: hypothetical protein V9E89_15040 [Ilumatobacteraceae bacterium]